MKKAQFIHKDRIHELLGILSKGCKCLAPVKDETGSCFFAGWDDRDATGVFLPPNTDISPKELLYPQTRKVFGFENLGGELKLTAHCSEDPPKPTLLFGLRPCDTAALAHLTDFSGAEPADREVLAKRRALKVVTVACAKTCEGGFCTWAGTGPVASEGFDLQLIPYNDGFIIEGAGGDAFADYSSLVEEVPADVEDLKAELTRKVSKEQGQYDTGKPAGRPPSKTLKKEFARRCQKCGGCVFICPTCTCFNIMDRLYGDKGERLKVWDSCFLDGFTVVAGGGNPVKGTEAHLDRRLWCKDPGAPGVPGVVDKAREKPGRAGKCVGCGRCDRVCPGSIGMGRMLELL